MGGVPTRDDPEAIYRAMANLRPRPTRAGGLRFLFDCGTLDDEQLRAIRLQEDEIEEHRFVPVRVAAALLTAPLRRRVSASIGAKRCVYLEDGKSAPGVV